MFSQSHKTVLNCLGTWGTTINELKSFARYLHLTTQYAHLFKLCIN
jgi:hypothetical protein